MNSCTNWLLIPIALVSCSLLGCGSDENTVIQPTVTYELTDQEKTNREQAEKMLAEQRQ